jgi:outer membrane receptor protein involved in Fe transport
MDRIKRKVLLLAAVICIATVKIYAQSGNTGKISGKIVDAQTNETIPYASAVLTDRKTKAPVRIVQSDLDGNFTIPNLPNGVFTFKASYVGYQTMVRDSISITGALKSINLGTIKMKTGKGNILNEVTVTAQKPTMQLGIDKKVFSVDQSVVSEGGSATDVLQNVPSVQTDMDGNVSLRGSTGVRVLIDGKPSLIGGGDVAQILKSIPASSIETIEVISNPSAKYDAEGQSGIINIVLKKNRKLGLNGTVALTAGNRENYNANTSLSFQNNKINLYGNYSYRYGNRLGGGFNNISYKTPTSQVPTFFTSQNRDSKDLDKSHNLKAGIDYYLAEKTVVSLSGGLNIRNENERELIGINRIDINSNPLELSDQINTENSKGNSYDLALDFSQKFKTKGRELTANIGFSEGDNDNLQLYNTNTYFSNPALANPTELQNTDRYNHNRNLTAQVDFTTPLGQLGKIETGYRSQIRNSENNTFVTSLQDWGGYLFETALSNDFNSKDQVHAIYVNYQNQIKNFGYQIGLRGEDATLDTRMGVYDQNADISYTPGQVAYTRLYPSIYLTQKLKGEHQLQASYSRRVNRPRGWDTNPFLDISDRFNYRRGNVNLLPEDVHAFELSYSKFFKKFSLVSSIYFRKTNDVIQRVTSDPDPVTGITLTTPQNLAYSTNSGVELIGRFDLVKKWNFTANVNLYQRSIRGILNNDGYSYNANLTNNFTLPYGVSLQIRGEYRSREVMAQGTRNAMYGVDAGAKMDFYDKKASLSLNIRDVFASRKWEMQTLNKTSTIDFSRYMLGRMANLTLSYRFGKNDFNFKKSKKTEEGPRPDEETF